MSHKIKRENEYFHFVERLIVRLCGRINQIPTELDNDKIIIPMITKNAHE